MTRNEIIFDYISYLKLRVSHLESMVERLEMEKKAHLVNELRNKAEDLVHEKPYNDDTALVMWLLDQIPSERREHG